jgi:PAS domain S-box-containing protein
MDEKAERKHMLVRAASQTAQQTALSRAQLDTLLATAPVGLAYFDRDLRYQLINERLAEINGLPLAAHLGKPVAEILPSLLPAVQQVVTAILNTGEAVKDHEFSGETPGKPGVKRYWNESWYPVRDDSGEILGFGVVVEEITERKAAERQLHRQALILAHISDAVVATDNDQRVTYMNGAAEKRYGVTIGEAVGRPLTDLYTYRWIKAEDETAAYAALEISGAWRGENVHITGSGREIPVESTVAVLRDERGERAGLLATIRDVTERKQAEEGLRQRSQELAKANAELTYFNSVMVGRELRMVELKKEIDRLCRQFGQPPRYGYETD